MFSTALALTGVLVTYARGSEIGRERFSDDGKVLKSEISLAGQKATVTLQRDPRQAIVEAGGKTFTREVPAGTLALENGHWQAYALAAEQYPEAREPTAVKVLLPASGVTLEGKLRVTPQPDKTRQLELSLAGLVITVEVAANGAVIHASVPAQSLEVRPAGAPAPTVAKRSVPEGVTEEPLEQARPGGKLRGVLWRPSRLAAKGPVVVFIAGSGPTDRDGNATIGLNTDCYRQLAEQLAKGGVASIRYDKRGVGASGKFDEPSLSLEEYAADVAAWVSQARADKRFGKVTVLGHSEGGLIALVLAHKTPVDALILVATAGRPLWQVLHEQLARQISGAKLAELDAIISALRDGKPVATYPPEHAALFRPSIEKLWRSEMARDPAELLRPLGMPVAVVQGETDVQVSVEDARRLAGARKDARLSLLPNVNHVLKREDSRALPQDSYTDPARPLGAGVSEAVLQGIAR